MSGLSVSILGSFRKHYTQIVSTVQAFEANGINVKSPSISRIINPGDLYVRLSSDPQYYSDYKIQEVTLTKILSSDFLYVVNPGGYVGRTTCYELGRAHERGIPTYYLEPIKDLPIKIGSELIFQPPDLAHRMMVLHNMRRDS
ncbi:hypothetical protein GCM10009546_52130 [Actinomadura livida]|uniref:Uncharacterized protein n=1 Tax=Actinomadura livida TaxID=79909 RepID=A0ABN1F629_9ACTN|nr:hypothetical protein GCM10010208_72840 [Actinomadura livida]